MAATTVKAGNSPRGLTPFSRAALWTLVLPLLFIAGVQLFVLSTRTDTYFAWTFASPLPAAFLGAGYWAALVHATSSLRSGVWAFFRTSLPGALTATTALTITTFLHLDKFHLNSPLLFTRFVTWVWIIVYIIAPPIVAAGWIIEARRPGAGVRGQHPLPAWMKAGFVLLAAAALGWGSGLFVVPGAMSTVWPWAVTPLAARAVGSWLLAFGVSCAVLVLANDVRHGAGTSSSLFTFCLLQLIVVGRFASLINWSRPLAAAYALFIVLGLLVTGANLLADGRLRRSRVPTPHLL
jgi:hypothetical protein